MTREQHNPLQRAVEEFLAAAAISGNELARRSDVATGTIKNIRNGTLPTDLDIYRKLAKAMDKPLAVLLGERPLPAADAPGDIILVPLNLIDPSSNPRKSFNHDTIAELADDMFAKGQLQPLVVRDLGPRKIDGVETPWFGLVAGGRRYRAAGLLIEQGRWSEGTRLACKLIKADDTAALGAALAENIQREDLNPIEEAQVYADLIKADPQVWDTDSLAAWAHKTRRYIQQRLKLLELPAKDQAAVAAGTLSVTEARGKLQTPKAPTAKQLDLEEFVSSRATTANAVRREQAPIGKHTFRREPEPGPIKAGRAYNPHPKALSVAYQFTAVEEAGDPKKAMPQTLELWDPHNCNAARYVRADLVASRFPDDGKSLQPTPTKAQAKALGVPKALQRADLRDDDDDIFPAAYDRKKKGARA